GIEEGDAQRQVALGAVVIEQAAALAAPGGDPGLAQAFAPAAGETEGGGDEDQARQIRPQAAGGGEEGGEVPAQAGTYDQDRPGGGTRGAHGGLGALGHGGHGQAGEVAAVQFGHVEAPDGGAQAFADGRGLG